MKQDGKRGVVDREGGRRETETERLTESERDEKLTERETERDERLTVRERDRETETEMERLTGRQTDRERER